MMNGPGGFFISNGAVVGGFYGWRIELDTFDDIIGRGHKARLVRRSAFVEEWWVNRRLTKATAVFCVPGGGKLVPSQVWNVNLPPEFTVGRVQAETEFFKTEDEHGINEH